MQQSQVVKLHLVLQLWLSIIKLRLVFQLAKLYILYKRKGLLDIIKPNNIYKGVLL